MRRHRQSSGVAAVSLLEILIAFVFAKYGGGLLVSYDEGAEKALGWGFLLAGIAVAVHAGSRL
jgi:hypothetical protein